MNTQCYSRGKDDKVGNTLQANWIPLSLMGVGITWLVAGNSGVAERVANDYSVQTASRRVREIAGDFGIGRAAKQETGHGTQILGPDGRPIHHSGDVDRKSGWVDQASGAARETMASVREAGTAVLDRATRYTDYGGAASDMAKRASGQMAETLQSNPWLVAIASMAAGALLAGILPPTRVEEEYVDHARGGLWTKANELGHQAAERVRELADRTASEP